MKRVRVSTNANKLTVSFSQFYALWLMVTLPIRVLFDCIGLGPGGWVIVCLIGCGCLAHEAIFGRHYVLNRFRNGVFYNGKRICMLDQVEAVEIEKSGTVSPWTNTDSLRVI